MDSESSLPENMENEGKAMRIIWIIVLFYLIFYGDTFAQTPHWQEFSHTRLSEVTYFTADSVGNLYVRKLREDLIRSKDKGHTWESLNVGKIEGVGEILFNSKGYIYVSTAPYSNFKIFRSKDDGLTWDTIIPQPEYSALYFFSFLIGPNDELYTASNSELLISGDDGKNWTAKPFITGWDLKGLNLINNTLFAFFLSADSPSTCSINVSRDNGNSWEQTILRNMVEPHYKVPFFKTKNQQVITTAYIRWTPYTAKPYLFITSDLGKSWDTIRTPVLFTEFIEDRNGTLIAHGLDTTGLFRSTDNGHSWQPFGKDLFSPGLSDLKKEANGILYSISGDFYITTVIFSQDDGESWRQVDPGLPEVNIFEMKNSLPGVFEVFSGEGYLKSADSGSNWALLKNGMIGSFISQYYLFSDTLMFAWDKGYSNIEFHHNSVFYRYSPARQRWEWVSSKVSVQDMAQDSRGTVYLLSHPDDSNNSALSASDNFGRSWINIPASVFTNNVPLSMEINSRDEIFIITGKGQLLKSSDFGYNFDTINVEGKSFLSLKINHADRIFSLLRDTVEKTESLFSSSDDGITWLPVKRTGLPDLPTIKTYFDNNDRIFTITKEKVSPRFNRYALYLSTDNGDSWMNITGNLDSLTITSVNAAAGRLYAGTSEKGIFMLEDSFLAVKESGKPISYLLNQNYPNPFNSSTVISYSIPSSSNVELKIYDILGKEAATLVNKFQSAGSYKLNFNAGNLSTGIYFYRITAGRFSDVKKFILLK